MATTSQIKGRFWGVENCSKTLPWTRGLHSAGVPSSDVGEVNAQLHNFCCLLLLPTCPSATAACCNSAYEVITFPRLLFSAVLFRISRPKSRFKLGTTTFSKGLFGLVDEPAQPSKIEDHSVETTSTEATLCSNSCLLRMRAQ